MARKRAALCWLCAALLFSFCPAFGEAYDGAEETAQRVDIDLYWRDGAWTVPEGVERIDWNCLFNSKFNPLYSVRLPGSLRVLDGSDLLYCYQGYRLEIPEGVVDIVDAGFEYSNLRRILLPSTLERITGWSLGGCDMLEFIRLAEGNRHFKVIDNVLFTADGKTLVFYPSGKRDAHYAVPDGVEVIGRGAITGNNHLLSLSLPLGVTTIETSGIRACGRLESVSLPLTVRAIGDYCFGDCVSLRAIHVPAGATLGEECFDNCPFLGGAALVQIADGRYMQPDLPDWYAGEDDSGQRRWFELLLRPALLSPKNAADTVAITQSPDRNSAVLCRAACGSYVEVADETPTHYRVYFYSDRYSESACEGYVPREEIALTDTYEPLFEIETVRPKSLLSASMQELRVLPNSVMRGGIPPGACDIIFQRQDGQWIQCQFTCLVTEEDESYIDYETAGANVLWLGDVIIRRVYIGDDRTLGMAVASAPGNRVNLRPRADRASGYLDKYFTGTQLEVLGEENGFYHVKMNDGTVGYMMADYVAIVEQEAF